MRGWFFVVDVHKHPARARERRRYRAFGVPSTTVSYPVVLPIPIYKLQYARLKGALDLLRVGQRRPERRAVVVRGAIQAWQPSQWTTGRTRRAYGGFSPTPWLAPHTPSSMAPGAPLRRPRAS